MAGRERTERASPLASNYVERSGFRRRSLCVLTLLALAEIGSARAACAPAGSSHGDTIVCSGSQTQGLVAKSGNDSISILPGASVSIAGAQSATAVDAGSGNDSVVNDGRVSVTLAPPAVAPAGKSSSCSASWDVQGVGIAGGGGYDLINNRGAIAVLTTTAGGAQPPQGDSSHSENKHDDDHGHPPAKPAAASIGILGDSGNDQISNSGSVVVTASSDSSSPQVIAKGIAGGNGNDTIVNTGTIAVTASSTAASSAPPDAGVSALGKHSHGSKRRDISETGSVTAVGIEGGNDRDVLRNDGALTVNAAAKVSSSTRSLTLTGGDEVTATTTLDTRAVGISGGAGNDTISSTGNLTVNATSEISSTSVNVNLIDLSHSDTSTFVRSSATGIDAGSGRDAISIANTGTVAANATSKSGSVGVEVGLVDAATGDSKLEVQATATGIAGGQGRNTIDNSGAVKASATSQNTDVSVGVTYADLTIADRQGSTTSTTVESKATGIDGTKGANSIYIASSGSVEAAATSSTHSLGVSVSMEGVPQSTQTLIDTQSLSSTGITASSTVTGVAGGGYGDSLSNAGSISSSATSSAKQENIGVGVSVFELVVPTPNIGLVGAGTAANANATGIAGGRGDDTMVNSGLVKSDATASADAKAFSISIGVFSVDVPGIPSSGIPLSASLIVADTATTAAAQSTGIAGGAGDDTIRNTGSVQTQATATAGSTAVSAAAKIELEKDKSGTGEQLFAIGAVAARAGTEASSQAVGIDGGDGANWITNDGSVTAGAASNATAVAASVNVAGTFKGSGAIVGLAVTDTSSTATADATGIRGGGDRDRISSTGSLAATANADVIAVSASLNVAIAKESGFAAGAALARAESIATANATGIDGAGGQDAIDNTGTIAATARANADAVGVSVAVEGTKKGVAGGAALTDTSTTATAAATGIKGSAADNSDPHRDDDDWNHRHGDSRNGITNAGGINADAQAQALSVNASVAVSIAEKGLAIEGALARAESIATASATGIDGTGGNGEIGNTGTIGATAKANADAVGVSIAVAGTKQGVAGGAALTDTSTTATATATGIKSGEAEGGDRSRDERYGDSRNGRITNASVINADAQAQALSVNASVAVSIAKQGVAIGGALARAESNAAATAIGIDGAGGQDPIDNTGTIAAKSTANADAVGVSVAVAGTKQGVAGSAALTDTSTTATATSIGIRGGAAVEDRDRHDDKHDHEAHGDKDRDRHDGHDGKDGDGRDRHDGNDYGWRDPHHDRDGGHEHDDRRNGPITNANAISVEAQAHALSVSASANVSIAKEGVALGAALADTSTHAAALAKGIEAGSGDDEINNDGAITAKAGTSGQAVSVALTVEGTATGLAAGAALVDASVHTASTAIGADGAAGDDRITNRGTINIEEAESNATAVGVAVAALVAKQGAAVGAALADTSATAVTVATGMAGGAGNDVLTNAGAITAKNVSAGATAVSVSLDVALSSQGVGAGAALANSGTTASATATGLDGGTGNDVLVNQGSITLQGVEADSTAVSVSLAVAGAQEGLALSAALVDATATSTATAIGMAGGAGNDKLTNVGAIVANDVKADANAVGVSVSASFSQTGAVAAAALAKTGTTASATAKGLDGGESEDSLTNAGSVTLQQVKADAGAVSVSVGLSGAEAGVTIAAGLADASGKASATATGLDGGAGDDTLLNDSKGKIAGEDTGAAARAAGITVALSGSSVGLSAGAALADTSGTATSTAKGLDGGDGNDTLLNDGGIALKRTTADADSTSASVSISASLSAGVAAGAALSRAGATADATAIGIDGGAGNDWMLNRGSITVDGVTAKANATGVSVQLGVATTGVAIGAALADTRSTATATAKGMDGGAGDDWLKNEGQIAVQNVKAEAQAVSVGVSLNAAIDAGVAAGVALTDGRGTATATAIGMDGGAGRDTLINSGSITVQNVEAKAHAAGVSVSVNASMAGLAAGAALADTSATARTVVKGMDGGDGDDKISNTGAIDVHGKATADALSLAIGVNVAVGVAVGGQITNASTTAETTAIGVDAGMGRNEIANSGAIAAAAEAESKGASISVGINFSVGGDATLADAKSSATATAIGINDAAESASDSANTVANSGAITATATAKSQGVGVAGDLKGFALGATTNTATAEAVGIRMSEGMDQIQNEGAISATSNATATGLAVSVTLAGKALGDASTTAQAIATGIESRGGDDEIDNQAAIQVQATSHASAQSVSVGLAGSSRADASTRSLATATGIDGGAGDDQLTNRGGISAIATATASANGTRVQIFGVSNGDVSTKPTATAVGISGSDGNDSLVHLGTLNVVASSSTSVSSASWQIGGSAGSSAGATAEAIATGLDGGAGNDQILNRSTSLTVSADAAATASSASWTLAGVAGDSAALLASARATGIDGGAGANYLRNETALGAAAHATLSATGGSDAIFGGASSDTKIGAEAFATGIDAGTGDNRVENLGAVTVTAAASVTSDKTSFSFAGNASIGDLLAARSSASGIVAGGGNDSIDNAAQIFASATSFATATNGADADLGGNTHASGSANGDAIASGIDAGAGNNRVDNRGVLTVGAGVTSTSNNDSSAGFFFSSGGVIANAVGTVRATGINAGNGDSTILNSADLSVGATATVTTNAHAAGGDVSLFGAFGGNATASATSRAQGDVAGVRAGDGNHVVLNDGVVNVTLDLNASASTNPNAGDTGGNGDGFSTASAGSPDAAAHAAGIVVGNGSSTIGNTGTLSISAKTTAFAGTDPDGSIGGHADGFVTSDAAVIAAGIQAGDGAHLIANSGPITVNSNATATASVNTDAGFTEGGSGAVGLSRASAVAIGIGAGSGANQISNDGSLTIRANASSDSGVSAHGGTGAEPLSNAQSFASADASGIIAGSGNNLIVNTGIATVTAGANATGGSFVSRESCAACGGDNTSLGDSIATARATGIRVGNGNNDIRNDGTLNVGALAGASLSWDGDGDDNHRVASAKAEAIGIDTGNGNNVIVNRGTITATVFAVASVNGGLSPSTATAIGIRTGSGNDTVTNRGTITATTLGLLGVPAPGTAISTGAGDDTVILAAGSATNGNIDLGTGNNRLMLQGTPVINGAILDGSGSLALTFNATGSLSTALPGLSATKTGAGTFTLSTLNRMQHIEVDQGTLKLDNDYAFMSGGTFQAKVNGNGGYGQFYVNGQAALDGTMKIVRGGGAYLNGTAFDVLMASNGIQSGTAFSRVELPEDTRLLKFHTEQLSDGVRVKADVASFTTAAGTPNQMAVASTLDRILPKTTGTLNQLLGKIQVLPDAQFASAFASMSPAVYAGYTASTFNSMQQYANVLQDRMAALRAEDFSPARTAATWGGEPIRLAYKGKGLSDLLEASDAERARSSGLWLRGFSQKGDQNATEGMNGYDYRMSGTSIGYDGRLTNSFSLGGSLGIARNKVNVDSNVSQGDVDSTMGSVYAGYFDRRLYVNGTLSAGRNKYDTSRTLFDQSTATSSHDGKVLAATLGAGRYVQAAMWWVEPFATLQYTRLKEDAFSETGSSAPQTVDARTSNGVVSTLGARVSRPAEDGNGALWIPQASLAWLHDYSKTQVINASYIGAPDSSFSIDGQPVQRNGALVGLGLSYRSKGGYIITFQYNGEFRDGFSAHGLAGEFRWEF